MSEAKIDMKLYAKLRRQRFAPAIAKERRAEQTKRSSTAQNRASGALTHMFPDEYRAFYLLALAEVNTERGPLPGDVLLKGTTDAPW